MSTVPFVRLSPKGIEIFIKITPRASEDAIEGIRRMLDEDSSSSSSSPSSSTFTSTSAIQSSSKSNINSKNSKNSKSGKNVNTNQETLNSKPTHELEVRVTSPPDQGKANTALVKLLAKEWKVPSSDISIASGATSRNKKLLLQTDHPQVVIDHLNDWMIKSCISTRN